MTLRKLASKFLIPKCLTKIHTAFCLGPGKFACSFSHLQYCCQVPVVPLLPKCLPLILPPKEHVVDAPAGSSKVCLLQLFELKVEQPHGYMFQLPVPSINVVLLFCMIILYLFDLKCLATGKDAMPPPPPFSEANMGAASFSEFIIFLSKNCHS